MHVLLITLDSLDAIGGVENYNNQLVNIFKKNDISYDLFNLSNIDTKYNIDDKNIKILTKSYNILKCKNSLIAKFFAFIKLKKTARLVIDKIETKKYDIIIDSTHIYFKKINQLDNYLWIQHNNPNFYLKSKVSKNKIQNLLFHFLNKIICQTGNHFSAKNVVLFDQYNKNKIKINNNSQYYLIPLCAYSEKYIRSMKKEYKFNDRKHLIYIGRLENKAKNIKIFNKIHEEILIYGDGPDKKLLKNDNLILKNTYMHKDLIKIFSNTKFVLMPSNYEGFPYVIVESLSHGIPVLIKNSYPSAEFLIRNKFFLADNDKDFINKTSELKYIKEKEYTNLVNQIFEFAEQNLTLEIFIKKWEDILKKFENKSKK